MPAQLHKLTGAPPWLTTSGRTAVHTYAAWHVRTRARSCPRPQLIPPKLEQFHAKWAAPSVAVRASNPLNAERRRAILANCFGPSVPDIAGPTDMGAAPDRSPRSVAPKPNCLRRSARAEVKGRNG